MKLCEKYARMIIFLLPYLVQGVYIMDWAFEAMNKLGDFQFSVALLISFLAGLVTSFNPCMLGMASSVMAFQGESKKKSHLPIIFTFMLSFSITLTLLGVVSSFFGDQILDWDEEYGDTFYNLLAMIFILLGFYVIGLRLHHLLQWLPFKIIAFYSKQTKQKKSKHPIIKAYSLGTLFGLTPSPCTTPMILAMLAYTSVTGSVMLGGLLLLTYGIGHSIPFLIIGWVTGTVKRAGWMIRWPRLLNKGLGMVLILIGLYFFLYENTPMPM